MANKILRNRLVTSIFSKTRGLELDLYNSIWKVTRGCLFGRSEQFKIGNLNSQDSMASQEVKNMVDAKIAGKKVMVFSKSTCPFCSKAKKYIKEHIPGELSEEDYEVMEIESNPDCQSIQDYLLKLTGGRSVPRVFINSKFIGGGDETEKYHKNGKLSELLKA